MPQGDEAPLSLKHSQSEESELTEYEYPEDDDEENSGEEQEQRNIINSLSAATNIDEDPETTDLPPPPCNEDGGTALLSQASSVSETYEYEEASDECFDGSDEACKGPS